MHGNSATERWALAERRRYNDLVTALVRDAQQEGSLADDIDPALLTRLVLGMTTSLIEWYRADGTWSIKSIADATLSLVCQPAVDFR